MNGRGAGKYRILPARGVDCVMFAHGQRSSRRHWFVPMAFQWLYVNIALQRINRNRLMRKRTGVGGAKCNNQTEIGRDGDK